MFTMPMLPIMLGIAFKGGDISNGPAVFVHVRWGWGRGGVCVSWRVCGERERERERVRERERGRECERERRGER